MVLYIPFIDKFLKKEKEKKEKPAQISLYIDDLSQIKDKKEEKHEDNIIIIDLF